MKKFIAMLLFGTLCISTLAGCGSADKAKEESTEAVSAEESDWAYIQDKGEMTVGMTLFAPMNYYDEDNNFVGFDTELANAVGEKLGIKIVFEEINWDSKEIELNSKNIDCIWNGLCITEERKQNMSITDPYLLNTHALVMLADREEEIMKDVSGLTVTSEQGSTSEGLIQGTLPDDETAKVSAKEFFANSNYVASDSQAKALMEVKSKTVDIAMIDTVAAVAMVGPGTDYEDLVVNTDMEFSSQYFGVGFRKGSDMTEKVNATLDELYADGTVEKIAEKYNLTDVLVQE